MRERQEGPADGAGRVLRGGSWNNDNPDNFRCANRNNNHPENRNDNNGFRAASTLPRRNPFAHGLTECAGSVQAGSWPRGRISKPWGKAGSARRTPSPTPC